MRLQRQKSIGLNKELKKEDIVIVLQGYQTNKLNASLIKTQNYKNNLGLIIGLGQRNIIMQKAIKMAKILSVKVNNQLCALKKAMSALVME